MIRSPQSAARGPNEERSTSGERVGGSLFRPEAVEHRARRRADGDILRNDRRWTRWAYWLVLVLVVIALGFAFVVPLSARPESASRFFFKSGTSRN